MSAAASCCAADVIRLCWLHLDWFGFPKTLHELPRKLNCVIFASVCLIFGLFHLAVRNAAKCSSSGEGEPLRRRLTSALQLTSHQTVRGCKSPLKHSHRSVCVAFGLVTTQIHWEYLEHFHCKDPRCVLSIFCANNGPQLEETCNAANAKSSLLTHFS